MTATGWAALLLLLGIVMASTTISTIGSSKLTTIEGTTKRLTTGIANQSPKPTLSMNQKNITNQNSTTQPLSKEEIQKKETWFIVTLICLLIFFVSLTVALVFLLRIRLRNGETCANIFRIQ